MEEGLSPMTEDAKPLLHICYAPADYGCVHGRMVDELGLQHGQYHTREDDGLGQLGVRTVTGQETTLSA
jgi:hypothetical protein